MNARLCFVVVLLAGCSGKEALPSATEVETNIARTNALALSDQCQMFFTDNDRWPSSLSELVKPPKGHPSYVKEKQLLDPWGRSYQYDAKGPKNEGKAPDIWTVPPGRSSTVGNWDD